MISGIVLAANQNVNVSFVMKPGAAQTTVSVQAGTTLVDTRESTISTTIEQDRIVNLPLADRKAYGLVILVPGVTGYLSGALIGDQNNSQFSMNGLPANYNSYYLDGSYNTSFFHQGGNLPPNPDALAEFSILTSNQDAEFGRYPGAVVNTITRSGTNQFHGLAYDYLRNTILNAKNYFNNVVTPLHYNVYGGDFGGPAIRSKLFFFLSYEGIKQDTHSTVNSTAIVVPSDLERQGNFSQSSKKPTKTGCPAGQNPVPPATICMDPISVNLLKYIPEAVTSVNGVNYPAQQNASNNILGNQGVARLDYQLNAAHKLQFTFFQSRGTQQYPNGDSTNNIYDYAGALYSDRQSNYIVGDTWILSPHAVNSFRGVYSLHNTVGIPHIFSGTGTLASLANLGSAIPEGDLQGLTTPPTFGVTGYFSMGGGNPTNADFSQLTYGINDTLNYTRGRHTVRAGVEFLEDRFQETAVSKGSSGRTFTGAYTGNALADFLEGRANTFNQDSGFFNRNHSFDPSVYAQDDWRIRKRLTLNLGVRWEVFNFFAGGQPKGTFVPGVQSKVFPTAPVGLVFNNGDPGIAPGIGHTSYLRFAPRIGFADDVWGNGRLSLRGAFGIFYTSTPLFYTGFLVQGTLLANVNSQQHFEQCRSVHWHCALQRCQPIWFSFQSEQPDISCGGNSL